MAGGGLLLLHTHTLLTTFKYSTHNTQLAVDFYGGRKTGEKTFKARERISNKLNSHMTLSPGIEPGSQW
jgi:hypothetical protein